jgi:transcription elongation factor Elf1
MTWTCPYCGCKKAISYNVHTWMATCWDCGKASLVPIEPLDTAVRNKGVKS